MITLNPYNNLSKEMHKDLDEHYKTADKTMLIIMFVHWILGTFVFSTTYDTYLLGAVISSLILGINIYAYKNFRGESLYRIIVAISLLSFSVLFIQEQFGRIEMHFHVFIALSFLMIYKDVKPVITGAVFTIVHHILFFVLQKNNFELFGTPIVVFNDGCGYDILLLHAFFVIFELIVLLYILNSEITQFIRLVKTNHKIKNLNANLEDTILKRTKDLLEAKEKAEESVKIKEEFLANMSHEIRTPMNAVLGFADLLYEGVKEPKYLEYIKSIRNSGKHLLLIINDILEISKIQAGKMQIELKPVNPYALFKDLHSTFKMKIDEKNIEFIIDIDQNLPKSLLLDEVRIRQILFNLIGNAVKFTQKGFIKISATSKYYDEDKSIMDFIIKIEDSGIGIAKQQQEKIFSPFTQQSGQSVEQYGGTGLGLTISKKLANLMGGDITLESDVDRGSVFTVLIKNISISSTLAEEDEVYEYQYLKSYKFKHAKVLIVDDIETNRTLIKNYLSNYDLEIGEAENGADAVRLSKKGFDLILMDIKMPIMDGYEATKIIKTDPLTSNIPVFALTASVVETENTKNKNVVFDNFLCKPISKKNIVEAFAAVLEHHIDEQEIKEATQEDRVESHDTEVKIDDEGIKLIKNVLIPELKNSRNSGDIDTINNFAVKLKEFSDKYGVLAKDTEKLSNYIEAFDIENIFLIFDVINIELKKFIE